MNEKEIAEYCQLLSDELVSMYGISNERAACAVRESAIQTLLREEPEYVNHVPISSWAEDVYREMIARQFAETKGRTELEIALVEEMVERLTERHREASGQLISSIATQRLASFELGITASSALTRAAVIRNDNKIPVGVWERDGTKHSVEQEPLPDGV